MNFRPYIHVERYGTDETEGIECGECYIFPKLDGTAGSVFLKDGNLVCTSRKRVLSLANDNHGFCAYILDNKDKYLSLLSAHPHIILYGEFLIPHSLKTYRDEAWRKFYIYDVYDTAEERYLQFKEYSLITYYYDLEIISPLAIINNGNEDRFRREVENNTYLIKENSGVG